MTKRYIVAYLATATPFIVIDYVWLGFIAGDWYRTQLGPLLAMNPNLAAAAIFYVGYPVGIVILAVRPTLQTNRLKTAIYLGGLLGLIAYGTYDLTNLATLNRWPIAVAFVDTIWGGVITAISCAIGSAITHRVIDKSET